MIKHIAVIFLFLLVAYAASAQAPLNVQVQILKAEDARDYDGLKPYIFSKDLKIQARAVLAAARIGDPASVDAMAGLLENGDASIRPLAAFALGEIEAEQGAVFILRALADVKTSAEVRARAVEAAGKIAAANPKDPSAAKLAKAIVDTLDAEYAKGSKQDRETVLLALTAALRSRPEGGDRAAAKFLTNADARIRADAANTLSRLRAKNANDTLRKMLANDTDAVARANAARALGSAGDKGAADLLIKAATADADLRVRVSAVRSLAALKDAKAAESLLARGEALFEEYKKAVKPNFIPPVQNEFIEISTAVGQILAKTGNARAIALFRDFAKVDKFMTAEPYIARVRIGGIRPGAGIGGDAPAPTTYRQFSTLAQILGELATYEPESDEAKKIKDEAPGHLRTVVKALLDADPKLEPEAVTAAPDALQAFARFKTDDLGEVALNALENKDVFIRAAAAGILADLPPSKQNTDALKKAFSAALISDKYYDDAQLAIMDALYKLDKKGSAGTLLVALNAPDYLVRKKAFELLADEDLQKELPGIQASLENARAKHKVQVLPYSPATGTKLGQLLNTDADYRRALLRRNGAVKALVTTEKGNFTIDLLPEDAPLTVDNFIKLARSNYFNGFEVHRVVPNFVMQDGDPRGDGNGGPGWSIRCEINMVPYERGAVGMALSGKDTGGSQWFVTHSPQPHLDGGYTVFGRVNETEMKIVDDIVRGDKIVSIKIVEGSPTQRVQRKHN